MDIESYTERQRLMHARLSMINPVLAVWYLGTLDAISNQENPERYYQAAHSIREIMNKIPINDDLSNLNKKYSGDLTAKVKDLLHPWRRISQKFATQDPINGKLMKFLTKLQDFDKWFEASYPTRLSIASKMLEIVRKVNGQIAEDDIDANAIRWHQVTGYFTKLCHHNYQFSEAAFLENMTIFEDMLIGPSHSDIVDTISRIDELIKEVES
jgi:hypothetical protein